MGLFEGKVVFVTGAGRGQGRSHAVRFAQEGADVIALDVAREDALDSVPYPLASAAELDETIAAVEALDRRAVRGVADVRDLSQVQAVVDEGLEKLGKIDVVVANAGIGTWGVSWEMTPEEWSETVDTNLTGVWNATRAALPSMVERKEGGSLVLTGSTAALNGYLNTAHYTAAKHGVYGLTKVLAMELAEHHIRVNCVCPTAVNTRLIANDATYQLFRPDLDNPGQDDVREIFSGLNILPDTPWIEPSDVTEAVVWLASEQARFVTGIALPVDAGNTIKTW